ncbi:MAG: TraB/GumN family protein [Bacteroidetes bacterium]|nr:TraB/GumN family protein [Bacteroidota bacterium]
MRPFTFSFLLLPLLGWCQSPAKALLWKIEGHGLLKPSYVVGTVHSSDARAFRQVPQLLGVLKGQDVLAGEMDLSAGPATSHTMVDDLMMPTGKELGDFYTPKELRRVHAALGKEMGPMAMMADRMKPFFLMAFLTKSTMQADSSMVLDQYLQAKAKEMGKRVMGLETMEEQLAAVDGMPLQDQADMLYQMVRSGSGTKMMGRFLDAYAEQDLGRLAKMVDKGDMPDLMGKLLLKDRNAVMAHRMDSLMQGGHTFLFAIGAAHLPSNDGVLDLLQDKGYVVEAVDVRTGRQ